MRNDNLVTILVIDDNEAARYATTRVLRGAGFEVREAGDGQEGLAQVEGADLVLLDINLPDLDGYEVCRRLRANRAWANIPVVHLSATRITEFDKAHGLDAGADGYLTHPVEPQVLVATVNAFLRAREAERALRESEARSRAIISSLREGITFRNARGEMVFANPSFQEMVGSAGDPFASGSQHIVGEDGSPLDEATLGALRSGQPGSSSVVGIRRENGLVWLWANSQLIEHPVTGATVAVVSSFVDISERRRAESEREYLLASERAARAQAERANRLKDDFLATLSHELRTPLNAVIGWAQVLRMPETPSEDLSAGLLAIERNANLQAQLINDLLDVSRIVSGKLRLDMVLLHPAAPLEAALESVNGALQAKRITLQRNLDPTAGPVLGDAARLQQMVWNLVSNAVKFTPTGGTIKVELEERAGEVLVRVSDTGQGIAPELLPHVFERFFQVDSSTSRTTGGLGLGLAIVKQLVELHGGTVEAASKGAGRGATFTLRLPVAASGCHAPAPGRREPQLAEGAAPLRPFQTRPLDGVRVLVVEDDADARLLIERFLSACHAQVRTASNAAAGLELVQSWRPDVLLTDLGMPGRDGFALVREVRSRPASAQLPIIALTAFARAEDRERVLAEGFQAHVAKPVEPSLLIETVAAWAPARIPAVNESRYASES